MVTLAFPSPHGTSPCRMVERAPVGTALSIGSDASRRVPAAHADEVAPGEDALLVASALAGSRSAEEQLYRRHAPSVLRLATRLLRSSEDAGDVLQDTFVSAFEDLAALREPSAFRAWVHRIAVRLVHRRFRKRRLLRVLGLDRTTEALSLEDLADPAASPESRIELRWLDAALARIDHRDRIAWMLRNVEGLPLEDAAAACDCSLATVKRRIAAAEAAVQRHFEEAGR